jgi:hypothetical protein
MLLKCKLNFKGVGFSSTLALIITFVIIGLPAAAQNFASSSDTTRPNYNDSLRFPIHDRRGDFISDNKKSTYDLSQPPNIDDSIAYDSKTQLYTVRLMSIGKCATSKCRMIIFKRGRMF